MPKVVLKVSEPPKGDSLCEEHHCALKHLEKQPKYVPAGHFSIYILEIKENVWENYCFKSDKKMHHDDFLRA